MEDFPISYNSVIRANQIGFILSEELYNINIHIINNYKIRLLDEIKCTHLNEYFDKIKKICKDYDYTYNLLIGKEKMDDTKCADILILHKSIKKEYIELVSHFQKIVSIQILYRNIFNMVFYLPCFSDNRGRQYYSTLVSPTFYILFRYLYKFSTNKEFLNLEKSIFYTKIIKYKIIVSKFNLNEKKSYIAIILFIEIGKFFIKDSNNYIIKTEDIIRVGIEKYEKKTEILEFEDILYLNKIYYLLDELILSDKIDNNSLIFKDATASGLQNYGIILGYKNEYLEFLNINGND
jgi:hypothetical protein